MHWLFDRRRVLVGVSALAASLLIMAGCDDGDAVSARGQAQSFRELARQRGVLPDRDISDESLDSLGQSTCDDGYTTDEIVMVASLPRGSQLRKQPTSKLELVYNATIIDAYCPDSRAKVDAAARQLGLTLPSSPTR